MDENDATQVMPPAETPPEEPAAEDPPEAGPPRRTTVPRRWLAAAVVAVILLAAGIGIYLGTRGQDETDTGPQVAEADVTETDVVDLAIVPDLRGMTLERATQDAEAAGFIVSTATAVVESAVCPAGAVLTQEPLPGTEVQPGSTIALVIAEAPAVVQPPAGGSSGGTPPDDSAQTAQPPAPPSDVQVGDISRLVAKPKAIDLGLIQLAQWTTALEHQDTALQWQSGTITLGGAAKRILLTATGPNGGLVAVWSWDATSDSDWDLETVVVSSPEGATFETVLEMPAGQSTYMVKSNNSAILWKVQVQEKK